MSKEDRYAHLQTDAEGQEESAEASTPTDESTADGQGVTVTISNGSEETVVELPGDVDVEDVRRELERVERTATNAPRPPLALSVALETSRQTVRTSAALQRVAVLAPFKMARTIAVSNGHGE